MFGGEAHPCGPRQRLYRTAAVKHIEQKKTRGPNDEYAPLQHADEHHAAVAILRRVHERDVFQRDP